MAKAAIGSPRWFDSTVAVDRRSYLLTGLVLAAAKYGLEAALVGVVAQRAWPLRAFLTPLATMRADALGEGFEGLILAIAAVSLPFLFIGLSMSVRRASNAGLSPFLGLFFVVPFLNYVTMLVLSVLPERARKDHAAPRAVHRIHLRVLEHVARQAEAAASR